MATSGFSLLAFSIAPGRWQPRRLLSSRVVRERDLVCRAARVRGRPPPGCTVSLRLYPLAGTVTRTIVPLQLESISSRPPISFTRSCMLAMPTPSPNGAFPFRRFPGIPVPLSLISRSFPGRGQFVFWPAGFPSVAGRSQGSLEPPERESTPCLVQAAQLRRNFKLHLDSAALREALCVETNGIL